MRQRQGRLVRRAGLALASAGVNPISISRSIARLPKYARDCRRFKLLCSQRTDSAPTTFRFLPALSDSSDEAGAAGSEYFLGDLWVARRVFQTAPARHVDVGSRIDGLVAHLLTFRDVDVVDIRPLTSRVDGMNFVQADATSLNAIPTCSIPSASSMHALEHFGLGRYGDPIDPDGHIKAIRALGRVVERHGDLYIGVPVGRPAVEFNAHRILSPTLVPTELPEYELVEFAAVTGGVLHEQIEPQVLSDAPYALGLYHLRRTRSSNDSRVSPL